MSFPAYPGYKHSGVELLGEFPDHWTLKRFKNVFVERAERSADGTEELLSVSAYFGIKPRSETLDEGDHLSRADSLEGYKVCHAGDLVINIMLAWNRGLGFSWQKGIVSPAYSVFHVVDGSSPRFLDYLVRSDECIRYFKTHSAGIMDSRLRLYPESFGRLFTAIPPACEQTQIARFLDHETARIDALIEEQQRLIELLKEKRQAVISHAVTKGLDPTVPMKDSGVEWLGEVPAHWDVRKFYFGIKTIIDNRGRSPSYIDSGIPILEARQLSDEAMECSSDFSKYISEESHSEFVRDDVAPGDVLMVTVGTVGKVGVVGKNPDYVILQNIVGFRVDYDIEPGFMGIYLKSGAAFMAMQATNKESILSSVKVSDFIQHKMPLPPLAEQKSIVHSVNTSLSKYGVLQKEAELLCSTLHERRSALISAAVTGKIDVRGWQPPVSAQAPVLELEAV